MKKLYTVLILSLALSSLFAHPISEKAEETGGVPEVGTITEGFVVRKVGSFNLIGADTVLYEHIKTGAQVLYFANDDTNRVFEITFKTPPETDTGVPHVFEHSTLGGSEKYPSSTLFFNLSFQTYNTFMNALTYPVMTTYPVASLSEEQLLKYADFYTDSCFNPMICEDKSIFDEEAWRYALDENGDLAIEGTVYSEMLGSYTLETAASYNFKKTIFPGSVAGNSSGGNPDHIPEMTWEDLISYHDRYYTPSNSVTCIYGKIDDIDSFLSLLDGYFSKYEKTAYSFTDSLYTPIEDSVEEVYTYAVEASTDTEKSSSVYYGFTLGELSEEEIIEADFLATLLSDSSSVLMENLKNALPYGSFSGYADISGPETLICFTASSINESDGALFRKTIDDSLLEIYENGFDSDQVEAVIASSRLSTMLTTDSSDVGTTIIPNLLYYWACTGNLFSYMNYINSLDDFASLVENGTLISDLDRFLLKNTRTALVTTKPVAGLKEEKDASLKEKLSETKASMTEDELLALSSVTKDASADNSAEYIKLLQAVTVENLPEEIRKYEISDETGEDGVRRIFAECNTSGIGYATLMLNTDWVESDKLHYLKLYIDLLGELDTSEHTRSQLANLSNRYMYKFTLKSSVTDNLETGEYHPYIRLSFISLDEDMEKAYEIIDELLFDSQLDEERIKDTVSSLKQSLKSTINSVSYTVLIYSMFATADESTAYSCYLNLLDYYDFLDRVSVLLEENPGEVISSLAYIRDNLASSSKAISAFAGSRESCEIHRKAADAFISSLGDSTLPEVEYHFDTMGSSLALIVDSNVNYNMMFASYEDMGLEEYTADLDAVSALINDNYLLPSLRDKYGVYGAYTAASDYGIYMYTYRDPNIAETFAVYAALPSFMESLSTLDQETLNGYILSSYSNYAKTSGELKGAMDTILDYISYKSQEKKIEYMKELKNLTVEKVREYASAYTSLVENGIYATSGSASAISSHSSLYEEILNPFGVQDSSKVVLKDITEDDEGYNAVRYAFENGYMTAREDSAFGVNDSATIGDLAVFFYMMIGGTRDTDAAVSFLTQYGIIPQEAPKTPITRLEGVLYTYSFLQAIGESVTLPDSNPDYADAEEIPEGYEAVISFGLENGLISPIEGLIKPTDTMTRLQLAQLIFAFVQI